MFGRQQTTTRIDRELAQLRKDLDAAYDSIRRFRPGGTPSRISMSSLNPWHRQSWSDPVSDGFSNALAVASRGAGVVTHQLDDTLNGAVRVARRHPVQSGIILVMIGIAVGLAARKVN